MKSKSSGPVSYIAVNLHLAVSWCRYSSPTYFYERISCNLLKFSIVWDKCQLHKHLAKLGISMSNFFRNFHVFALKMITREKNFFFPNCFFTFSEKTDCEFYTLELKSTTFLHMDFV